MIQTDDVDEGEVVGSSRRELWVEEKRKDKGWELSLIDSKADSNALSPDLENWELGVRRNWK